MYRIYAIVEERAEPQFVATLSESAYSELDDGAVESLVRNWCDAHKLTFIDYQG